VLGRGQDRGRVGQPVTLVAADHGRAELADQERVLAEGLVDPAPAQVAGDAQHRREGPVDAGRGDLDGGGPGDPLDQPGVPAGGHRELGREDRRAGPEAVPVDAVLGGDQRDAEPGAGGQVDGLQHALRRGVQDRTGEPRADRVLQVAARVELEHLPDLLGQGHPAEQIGDALLHAERGITVRVRSGHEVSSETQHINKRPEVSHSRNRYRGPPGSDLRSISTGTGATRR
jgi:hypothetical protein